MNSRFRSRFGRFSAISPWQNPAPVREELFGVERLEQHAESLAAAQGITPNPPAVFSLQKRLRDNAAVLLSAYRSSARELENGRDVVNAAEWLLDNYPLVEAQIREIRDDLPPGFYRQLPKLLDGPFAGYPRIFGLAWAFVAHTDSHLDLEILRRFIAAYQRVQPLTIGELWATAITLRIVLVENLRRLADQITLGVKERSDADVLADNLLKSGAAWSALDADIATRSSGPIPERFASQLAKRLRDQDPRITPARHWLERRLKRQGITVDEVVRNAQQRQGASNVTMRNVITSLRLISDIDWAELFESVSLVDAHLRARSEFAAMDFATRNQYRNAIEQLARGSSRTELEIADLAIRAAQTAPTERAADPGFHLIAEGRPELERRVGFRSRRRLRVNRSIMRLGIAGYGYAILLTTCCLLFIALWTIGVAGVNGLWVTLFVLIGFLPASEVATAIVNLGVARNAGSVPLPGLELKTGVPVSLRTLIAVPTLLTRDAEILEQVERLEVHHLAAGGGDLTFALLSDWVDADGAVLQSDAGLLRTATDAIAELNRRYAPGPAGARFLLLHRHRVFNARDKKWMGWERKRGKLHELNRLLRGAADTSFIAANGQPAQVPADVRFVITLDADTRLPRNAARRLIGKMAHPLNRPNFSSTEARILRGYAILQPRITPALPTGQDGSRYQRIFSGPGGIDPYAAAASDVYQDLFGEGSYTGKGIYDVDAFEAALAGRMPENALLSHDLFEGLYARAGLASDVELIEAFPARYDVAAQRQHRWIRGDWQLLPWLFERQAGKFKMPAVGRWKMLDNLRRSMLAPSLLLILCLCWLLPKRGAAIATLLVLGSLAIPAFLPSLFAILPARRDLSLRNHFRGLAADLQLAAMQTMLSTAFLADRAERAIDAISRTLTRLFISHRRLLEWTTAAQASGSERLTLRGFYRRMLAGSLLGLVVTAATLAIRPISWPIILPFALLWLAAPALACWISKRPGVSAKSGVSDSDAQELRLVALKTWRYFETFVTPAENMLPPDNFQDDPKPVTAHRTSPTNIGVYLLSAVAARDFGWAGTLQTIERLEASFATLRELPRFKGHFFNWYGTRDLRVLEPAYVSSVDSGNLAGHLITLANACEEWAADIDTLQARGGLADHLRLARAAAQAAANALPAANDEGEGQLNAVFDEIAAQLHGLQSVDTLSPIVGRLAEKAVRLTGIGAFSAQDDHVADLIYWIERLRKTALEHHRDRPGSGSTPDIRKTRLHALADTARTLAMDMDFGFLLDPERQLLSIGYSCTENALDKNCYDLLASEARLASLFAIAKGDVPTRHWFRLGRAATAAGAGSALISWSGSMFEYLMPSLVMRAPQSSLLEQTNRRVVAMQQAYGRLRGVPWGISESAYNARDIEFTYQYANFGVPGLGLKRGLKENLVIAPYATGLATMVDPRGARQNYARLAKMRALGRYGFYEAVDFTRSRLPETEAFSIIHNFMAHHQGMTIVAIANTLLDARMRARFHREPMIQASELLLQERVPRDVSIARPLTEEVKLSVTHLTPTAPAVRRVSGAIAAVPVTHLLSNGRYAVMLTAAGAGYSHWRDIAVTRWRADATKDDLGSFVFLRDMHSGVTWSACAQPQRAAWDDNEVVFAEDHADFSRRDGDLATSLEVLVSSEHDGEVRRVTLTNGGRRMRRVALTSYAELALTRPATDDAHPAFAKMFIETEYLPEFGALVATRRLRSPDETPIWAGHFAVVEGEVIADPQYETDRLRFIGRDRMIATAAPVIDDAALSNTAGTVLDPIFSLRSHVLVPPGRSARVAFWTLVAPSRAELLDLIDKHHDRNAFQRAKTLAWTQGQVQLRHLGIEPEEAADFQRLAAAILYPDPRFRAASETIFRGAGPQSGLWPQGISGDRPIVLLRIDDLEDMPQVHQLLRAHEYWHIKRLSVDLVIINEHASSYMQDLQIAIETAIRSSQSRSQIGEDLAPGAVFSLRADLVGARLRALLQSVARVALVARRGPIADQLARMPLAPVLPAPALPKTGERQTARIAPGSPPQNIAPGLEFFNGLGGFDKNGREYVTVLQAGTSTPAPWINVIANPGFGFHVSAAGSAYSWAGNSRENQLTPWSNDPVCDPAGEAIYLRDEFTGEVWSPTAQPIRDAGSYIARHGFGYSRFEHQANGIASELLQYVPLSDPIKISRLTLRNLSASPRRLSMTAYTEWVLGASRRASAPFITTEIDRTTGALFARNPWSNVFSDRVAFADLGGRQTNWTGDRSEFLGYLGTPAAPAALAGKLPLTGRTGAGLDPCAALQCVIELRPNAAIEIVSFIGQTDSTAASQALIARYRAANLDRTLAEVTEHWENLLGSVQVRTPDRAMDIMLNGWLLYQTLACRIWARAAFYQASGAYGFRDQLQDGMALTFARPEETRSHLLRAAGRQFVEGDVQHWWLPHSGQGVRTHISDDRVWLAYATATYVTAAGDPTILDEVVPFLEGPTLGPSEHDAFFQPMVADEAATVFEHCARGLDQCLALTGGHGLPLMGTGDWNDGMSRVGAGGKGESVWLGWLLIRTIALFVPFAEDRDPERRQRWLHHAETVRCAIEQDAWDGAWYRRATFDDGTWLGSSESDECQIDSIAQSWAVLSGGADPARAATAMASLQTRLVRRDDDVALLFMPPFDVTPHDPGYIKGYPPGLRENGGQYTHAAVWAILALAKLGQGDEAAALFDLINPINHALHAAGAERYKVEPYVLAADVYSVAPHAGRGGWTWYTGSAGWMHRAGIEALLGIRREGVFLMIDPCIPAAWPGFDAKVRLGSTRYDIQVTNASRSCRGITEAVLDNMPVDCAKGSIRVALDDAAHALFIII